MRSFEEFWKFVDRTEQHTQCWIWLGGTSKKGYSVVSLNGTAKSAHKVIYEAICGPVPLGLTLDHLCRFKKCVRPDHLEPVTDVENKRRARRLRCQRGHLLAGDNLRPGRICRQCGNDNRRRKRQGHE